MKVLTLHEKERLLREAGFEPVRLTRHGSLWKKGDRRMMVPKKAKTNDPHSSKNWLADFRRAVEN